MQVTFVPTGEVMNTDLVTQQKGPTSPTLTQPIIGNSGWGGELTSGSLQWQVGGADGNYIVWKDHNTESTRTMWRMSSAAAVTNGLSTIQDALDAADPTLLLNADGSNGS